VGGGAAGEQQLDCRNRSVRVFKALGKASIPVWSKATGKVSIWSRSVCA
jgi:hypothetical protein